MKQNRLRLANALHTYTISGIVLIPRHTRNTMFRQSTYLTKVLTVRGVFNRLFTSDVITLSALVAARLTAQVRHYFIV